MELKHSKEYLDAKKVVDNPKNYEQQMVIGAQNFIRGYEQALSIFVVEGWNEQLNVCKPIKFDDWLSDNFTKRTKYYYDRKDNNQTYSIKEIESQYVMRFRTNI